MPEKRLISDPNKINLNDRESIQDILGNTPGWLLKWGISVVLFAIVIFLFLAWLIKYPDTLDAPLVITSEQPPIPVVAKVSGELDTILVKNEVYVEAGAELARINTPTNINDLIIVKHFLKSTLDFNTSKEYLNTSPPKFLELGEISNSYNNLVQRIESFQYILGNKSDFLKIQSIEKEIQQIIKLNKSLVKQEDLFEDDLTLTEKQYIRNKELEDADVISKFERENAESELLKHKRELENFKTNRITNEVRIQNLRTQINDIKSERENLHSTNVLGIRQQIDNLNSEIKNWEDKFIIVAPIDGQLSFSSIWSSRQYVQAENTIFTIVPNKSKGKTIAISKLPILGSGRVKKDNKVLIKLDAYPYQEFGSLETKVEGIGLVPEKSENGSMNFRLTFNLKDTLITNYNIVIPFQQNMLGTATIITEERSILDRVFHQLTSLIKN